ncbi:atypical protein kinase C-like [Microplitis mediator]|uniref:atypical protein kinase C-like n=1 Tax=Microplitis mediator TaxID=375433 RepID=UPI002552D72E|nr:atypical protein kinase C-like [Microplitis mediator]
MNQQNKIGRKDKRQEAYDLFTLSRTTPQDHHQFTKVFPNVAPAPGVPCQGEDRRIYRRGAQRWRKLYRVNGHIFQAKRFNRREFCALCQDRIWGLGRQGFKCIQCKLLVHKKCHKDLRKPCSSLQQQSQSHDQQLNDRNGDQAQIDSSPQGSPKAHLDDETTEQTVIEDTRPLGTKASDTTVQTASRFGSGFSELPPRIYRRAGAFNTRRSESDRRHRSVGVRRL